jgi:hypothetical protein
MSEFEATAKLNRDRGAVLAAALADVDVGELSDEVPELLVEYVLAAVADDPTVTVETLLPAAVSLTG